jgi:DNA-binding transcriptional ArsR family regulator
MEETDIVRSLAALAQAVRLRIVRVLVVAGRTGMTPGALAEYLDIPATTLSFLLKEITHYGLVTQERLVRYLIYRASFDHLNALLGYLTANCCQGDSCLEKTSVSCKR